MRREERNEEEEGHVRFYKNVIAGTRDQNALSHQFLSEVKWRVGREEEVGYNNPYPPLSINVYKYV